METIELTHIELPPSAAGADASRFRVLEESGLEERLGGGAIRKVRSTLSGDVFAMKEPNPSAGIESAARAQRTIDDYRKALREEYRLLCSLADMGLTPLPLAYGHHAGRDAIIMEWVEGMPLSGLAESGHLPAKGSDERAQLTAQLGLSLFEALDALVRIEDAFIHRDLAPHNILIRTTELSLDEQMERGYFDLCLMNFGFRDADPRYAAPELLGRDLLEMEPVPTTSKLDVYAACSLLWELMCGRPPYELAARAAFEDSYAVKMRRPRVASGLEADSASGVLARILERGLAADQNERPDIAGMIGVLRRYLELFPEVGELAEAPEERESSTLSNILSLLLILLVVAVAAFAWLIASLMPTISSTL